VQLRQYHPKISLSSSLFYSVSLQITGIVSFSDYFLWFLGRSEFRIFLALYLVSLPLQLLTTGSVIQQGSTGLVVLTALHAGVIAALFWALLGNAIISTQLVEDGTLSSLIVSVHFGTQTQIVDSLFYCTAFTSICGRLFCSNYVYLIRRWVNDNKYLWSFESPSVITQHTTVCVDECLASSVSSELLLLRSRNSVLRI
jgi:Chitin synthase export chaperone